MDITLMEMHCSFYGKVQSKSDPDALYQEKYDARMIREDHKAMANLPEHGYQVHWAPDLHMQRLATDKGVPSRGVMAKE
jgi:hypothetical protein